MRTGDRFHKIVRQFLDPNPQHKVERADELAKAGVELASNTPETWLNVLRRAKEKTLRSWKTERKTERKTGRYAIANRFPPFLKLTKHFTSSQHAFTTITLSYVRGTK